MANKRIGLAERKSQEARRPVEALFGVFSDGNDAETEEVPGNRERKRKGMRKKELIRQTYHMDPVIVEAIRIMEFDTREGISAMVNRFLRNNLPEDVILKAHENIEKRSG